MRGMGRIRSLAPEDLVAVVELRQRVFRTSWHETAQELEAYFHTVFLEWPRAEADPPRSLVYEDDGGRITGFVGVLTTHMQMNGRRLLVATPSQFMVAPEHRGMAGYQLLKTVLSGPQDLTYADVGNTAARRLFEGMGGRAALLYSFMWSRPLRPAQRLAGSLLREPGTRVLGVAAWPLMWLADAVMGRLPLRAFRTPRSTLRTEPLEATSLATELPALLPNRGVQPHYEAETLRRQFGYLAHKAVRLGPLHAVRLRDDQGATAGWFVYFVGAGEDGHVVQVVAAPGLEARVWDALAHHAREQGAMQLTGRVEPRFLPILGAPPYSITRTGPWVLVHSRHREVVDAIQRGDAFISRLEGEWWLSF